MERGNGKTGVRGVRDSGRGKEEMERLAVETCEIAVEGKRKWKDWR